MTRLEVTSSMSDGRSRPMRLPAARALHDYLARYHLREGALVGPDAGVRFNYRAGRLLKSYLRALPWHDDYYYLQAQGYWILGTWTLYDLTGAERYRDHAVAASRQVVAKQAADGSWPYPNPAWKGRIATAEGTWGCLGLVDTARRTGDPDALDAVRRWCRFMQTEIGFVDVDGSSAVRYFAGRGDELVPNNSALAARLAAELALLDDSDGAWTEQSLRLARFVSRSQLPSGEVPYVAPPPGSSVGGRRHFQCYQYNAFQLLDLLRCYEVTGAAELKPFLGRLAAFVLSGLDDDGTVFYDCRRRRGRVHYHTAAVAAALTRASQHGFVDGWEAADMAYRSVLRAQRGDGSLPFSRADYGFLSDQRAYPRNLVMVLLHLLVPETTRTVPR